MADFVTVENGRLTLSGQPFRHVGVNLRSLAQYSAGDRDLNLDTFAGMGVRGIRIFGAYKRVSTDYTVTLIGDLATRALSRGMRLIVSLTDLYCGDHQPPGDEAWCYQTGSGFTILSHDWFTGGFRENYLPWVVQLVSQLRDHRGILAWEIGNELKDEIEPGALISMTAEVASAITAIDSNHLLITPSSGRWSLLDEGQTRQWYDYFGVVQIHSYDGDRKEDDVAVAHDMGKAHIVGEGGFTADCGAGGRQERVRQDLDYWFNRGSDGYYQWGAQGQYQDIGDGDNIFGMDRYCHTDFAELYQTYAAYARQLSPGAPPPPEPPPGGETSNALLPLLLLLLPVGIAAAWALSRRG